MVILRLVLLPPLAAGLLYVACMGAWLRFRRAWLPDVFRWLTVFFAGMGVYVVVAPFVRGGYVSVLVHNLAFWVPTCALCALSAWSAFSYARQRRDYHVVGDPVEHWAPRLLGSRFWWTRLRAAHELAAIDGRDEEIRSVADQAWRVESNLRVRDALRDLRRNDPTDLP